MFDNVAPEVVRRGLWIGAAVLATGLVLPLLPAVASAFSPSSQQAAVTNGSGAWLASVEVAAAGTVIHPGQITQPSADTVIFVGCATGQAISGGYTVPNGSHPRMAMSAPSPDLRRWNFRFNGVLPVGAKLYAVCKG